MALTVVASLTVAAQLRAPVVSGCTFVLVWYWQQQNVRRYVCSKGKKAQSLVEASFHCPREWDVGSRKEKTVEQCAFHKTPRNMLYVITGNSSFNNSQSKNVENFTHLKALTFKSESL